MSNETKQSERPILGYETHQFWVSPGHGHGFPRQSRIPCGRCQVGGDDWTLFTRGDVSSAVSLMAECEREGKPATLRVAYQVREDHADLLAPIAHLHKRDGFRHVYEVAP